MSYYHVRCKESDVPALMALATGLGVLRFDEEAGTHLAAHSGTVWCPIGRLHRPTGATLTPPDGLPLPGMAVVVDADGDPCWHANLRFDGDLLQLARDAQAAQPGAALADGLAHIGRYFVVDPATGRATSPAAPALMFA